MADRAAQPGLAQGSMAPAGKVLGDMGISVLSSPRLGVQRLLRQLEK